MRSELVVRDILQGALPEVEVRSDSIPPRALSAPRFVFVTQAGGTATHPTLVEQGTVNVVTYGRGTFEEVAYFADTITAHLLEAWEAGTITDHGYLSRFTIQTLPTAQAITGIPAGVLRFSAQYGVSVRPTE